MQLNNARDDAYPVVVEGFGKIDDISPRYDLYPEQPVAAITVLGVIVVRRSALRRTSAIPAL